MTENQRILLAGILSLLVIYGWQLVFPPHQEDAKTSVVSENVQAKTSGLKANQDPSLEESSFVVSRDAILQEGYIRHSRVTIDNDYLKGSVNLIGASIDDIVLKKYKDNSDHGNVNLLSPRHTKDSYFISFGWVSKDKNIELPGDKTLWSANTKGVGRDGVLTLKWQNREKIEFVISITFDNRYLASIRQGVVNHSDKAIDVVGYTVLNRGRYDGKSKNAISHEGVVGVVDKTLIEESPEKHLDYKGEIRWLGFSDKYWLVAVISDDLATAHVSRYTKRQLDRFQMDIMHRPSLIGPGDTQEGAYRLYIGAKELDCLEEYEKKYNIRLFDHAVDFGILYFITKPIFLLLTYFNRIAGNFGVAIILLTVFIKALLFPIAYKGFQSMNKLKDFGPEIANLRELYKDDNVALQKATMALYKKEKINPLSGCLPILLQMPIFFALYKVLYVTIEMRQAPFFGWIKDLSTPDPTTVFNIFGLINWQPPSFLMIGLLPLLMGITLLLQQAINPQPTDPIQAKVMKLMPIILTVMFASFPSGLVLYWTWSNILSIGQQLGIKFMSERKFLARHSR